MTRDVTNFRLIYKRRKKKRERESTINDEARKVFKEGCLRECESFDDDISRSKFLPHVSV